MENPCNQKQIKAQKMNKLKQHDACLIWCLIAHITIILTNSCMAPPLIANDVLFVAILVALPVSPWQFLEWT
jgi:hypothetical protein